jgi:hypothetical protein
MTLPHDSMVATFPLVEKDSILKPSGTTVSSGHTYVIPLRKVL